MRSTNASAKEKAGLKSGTYINQNRISRGYCNLADMGRSMLRPYKGERLEFG